MIVEYLIDKKKQRTVVVLFKREENGELTTKFFEGHPYFFAEDPDGKYFSVKGKKLRKIDVTYPTDVPVMREKFAHHEADIPFKNRFLIDKIPELNDLQYKTMIFDIEVKNDGPGIIPSVASRPVISVAFYFEEEVTVFIVKNRKWAEQPYNTKIGNIPVEVIVCSSEKELLSKMNDYVSEKDPDIIGGWNNNRFDIPYLYKRYHYYSVPFSWGRKQKTVTVNRNEKYKIWGRILIDVSDFYRSKRNRELRSWSLDYVSKKENLNWKKSGKGKDVVDKWIQRPQELVIYNAYDVLSCYEIWMIDYPMFVDIQKTAHCFLDDVLSKTKLVTYYNMKRIDKKMILPSGPSGTEMENRREMGKIEGGLVLNPKAGFYKDVAVIDWHSHYPNIMRTFNISFDTIDPNGNCRLFNGVNIDLDKDALLVHMAEELMEKRDNIKAQLKSMDKFSEEYDRKYTTQYALKFIINSIYGVMDTNSSRFFNRDAARSVTWLGRQYLKFLVMFVEQDAGLKSLYSDTDSSFILTEEPEKDVQFIMDNFRPDKYYPMVCKGKFPEKNTMSVDLDYMFDRLFLTDTRKRYFGIDTDGKFIVKGFLRSDQSVFAEEFFYSIAKGILDNEGKFPIDTYLELKEKYMSEELSKIGIPSKRKKQFSDYKTMPINVRASLYSIKNLNDSDLEIQFTTPYLYYVKSTGPYPSTDVIAVSDASVIPKQIKIDREKMWEKMVSSSLGTYIGNIAIKEEQKINGISKWLD